MKIDKYYITLTILVFVQILICNYINLSPLIMVSILPVIILCLPVNCSCILSMVLAFACGLATDCLADGLPGLNALSLVAVAFIRRPTLKIIFSNGLFARKENLSCHKHGIGRIVLALIMVQSVFLILYIIADGAGMRPFSFNLLRFLTSLAIGSLVSTTLLPLLANGNDNKG